MHTRRSDLCVPQAGKKKLGLEEKKSGRSDRLRQSLSFAMSLGCAIVR